MALQTAKGRIALRFYSIIFLVLKLYFQLGKLPYSKIDLIKLTITPHILKEGKSFMLKSICLVSPLYLFLPKLLEFESNFLGCIPAFLRNSLNCWTSFIAFSYFTILSILSSMYVLWATVTATSVSSYWFSFAFFLKM